MSAGDWITLFDPCPMCFVPHGAPHIPGCNRINTAPSTSAVLRVPGPEEMALRKFLHSHHGLAATIKQRAAGDYDLEAMSTCALAALRRARVTEDVIDLDRATAFRAEQAWRGALAVAAFASIVCAIGATVITIVGLWR